MTLSISKPSSLLCGHGHSLVDNTTSKCSVLLLQVEAEIEAAKKSDFPPIEDLWNNIYVDGLGAKLRPIEISKPKIQL